MAWREIATSVEVIHPGAAERAVRGREACRLDDVRLEAEARGETKNRPRVLGNVGLEKRDLHGLGRGAASFGKRTRRMIGAQRLALTDKVPIIRRCCVAAASWTAPHVGQLPSGKGAQTHQAVAQRCGD